MSPVKGRTVADITADMMRASALQDWPHHAMLADERRCAEVDQDEAILEGDDAALDRWNDACLAALRGQPCPQEDEDSVEGYQHGLEERKVRTVVPERPEGYYHQNPNGEA